MEEIAVLHAVHPGLRRSPDGILPVDVDHHRQPLAVGDIHKLCDLIGRQPRAGQVGVGFEGDDAREHDLYEIASGSLQLSHQGAEFGDCLVFPAHDGAVIALFVYGESGRDILDAVVRRQGSAQNGHAQSVSPVPEIAHAGLPQGGQCALHSGAVHTVSVPLPGGGEIRPVHHNVPVALI